MDKTQPPQLLPPTDDEIIDGWIIKAKELAREIGQHRDARDRLSSREASLAATHLDEATNWLIRWQIDRDKTQP